MAVECRSQPGRLEATVTALLRFVREHPAAARFWLRMTGYFREEIGEPGHLTRIHQSYLQRVATLISGETSAELSAHDLLMAQMVDALGWAQINAQMQLSEPLLDIRQPVKAIKPAMPPVLVS